MVSDGFQAVGKCDLDWEKGADVQIKIRIECVDKVALQAMLQ